MTKIIKKEGHTINELIFIQEALKVLSSTPGTGLTFECSKNILLINPILKNYEESTTEVVKKFLIKDSKGEPILYKAEQTIENGKAFEIYSKDEKGDYIKAKEGEKPSSPLTDFNNEEYKKTIKKFNEELHKIDFCVIEESEIKQLMEKGQPLDGIGFKLIPLFDCVIK